MKQIKGQIGLFDERTVNEENECLGEPCMYCDVQWCSIKCFIRRGYIYDRVHRFARGRDGKPLRKNIENRIPTARQERQLFRISLRTREAD